MGLGEILPVIGGLGLNLLGLLKQFGVEREHRDWWANPPGTLGPGETRALPFLSGGDAALQREFDTFQREVPGGIFAAGQEERDARARADMVGRSAEIEGGISELWDPRLEEARKRFETPAVSQDEVDMIVSQLRGNVNRTMGARAESAREGAGARGLSPDALQAIQQGMAADAGFQTHQGQLAAELQQEISNRAFEQQRFDDLIDITKAYDDSLVPQQNIGLQLMQDTGGLGRLGATQLAAGFAEQGMNAEDARILANILTSAGMANIDFGENRRAANEMASGGGSSWGFTTPLFGFNTGPGGTGGHILGFGGSYGSGGGGGGYAGGMSPELMALFRDYAFPPTGSSGAYGGPRGLPQNPF
jgi:hypothetical protein